MYPPRRAIMFYIAFDREVIRRVELTCQWIQRWIGVTNFFWFGTACNILGAFMIFRTFQRMKVTPKTLAGTAIVAMQN